MVIQQRGKSISLIGAILQLLLAGAVAIIARSTDSEAGKAVTWFLAAGVPLWVLACFMFYCRQLEKREAREIDEITAAGATSTTIFAKDDQENLRPAASRVKFMDRWIAPIFAVVWALLQAAAGLMTLSYMSGRSPERIESPETGIIFLLLAAFMAFLFSRYCLGMSERAEWRILRATGGYLFANVLTMTGVAAAMVAAWQGIAEVDYVVAYAVGIIQLVLAGEVILNFLLDIYRPRVAGQENRFSFDSRLFNIVAQPGQVGHSMAEAINYQFGFEVSKSWFYQLLAKAIVPLLVFGALIIVAMTSIVVVDEGQKCVVLHLGQPRTGPDGTIQSGVLNPGLHLKWPWPIDSVRRFNTDQVYTILLGVGEARTQAQRESAFIKGKEFYIWDQDHGAMEERNFLIAAPPRTGENKVGVAGQNEPPPVNVVKIVVSVQYKIGNVFDYGFNFTQPEKLIESIASREMTHYCASATLDEPVGTGQPDRPEGLMTFGQGKAAARLQTLIQQATNKEMGDGAVKIVAVGFQAVHPPKEVAPDFEQVLEAERRQEAAIYEAQADANKILSKAAGDPNAARRLLLAIRKSQELETLRDLLGKPTFDKRLAESITQADNDILKLQQDVSRQVLMGQAEESPADKGGTPTQNLLAEYRQYRGALEDLRKLAAAGKSAELKTMLDDRIAAVSTDADQQLREAKGEPAVIVARAVADRWKLELGEMARAETFESNLAAYRASPQVFMLDRWLDTWDAVLPKTIKYVLATDRSKLRLWMDWTQTTKLMGEAPYTGPKVDTGSK
ncbi:MAG: hypothetical protein EHM48_04955 [Planctomycetaceae bacterium]|nr:MAG: hypothetical protein EHM48_04955 [Planctomycetaceae bacterium]